MSEENGHVETTVSTLDQTLDKDLQMLRNEIERVREEIKAISKTGVPRVNSTLTVTAKGGGKFVVKTDVANFKPEEIKVGIKGNELIIEAKQREKTDNQYISRHLVRRLAIPEGIDQTSIQSQLSSNGVLSVEARRNDNYLTE